MTTKPLIIGEQPGKNEGRIGHRLAAFAGISFGEFMDTFERMNLLQVRAEYSGKNMAFSVAEARTHADIVRRKLQPEQLVLVLGKRAAEALGLVEEYFMLQNVNGALVYVVPHPSGANRWFNDPANSEQMIMFMHEFVRKMKDGSV